MYVVQVKRKGSRRWHTVTTNPAAWEACNAWLGENAWVWPAHRYDRRITGAE